MRRTILKGTVLTLGLGLLSAAYGQATPFSVSGTTTGYFNNGLSSIDGLTYRGSTFNVELNEFPDPIPNILNFNGDLYGSAATPNVDNLGSFFAGKPVSTYAGDTFTLVVDFTSPSVVSMDHDAITTWTINNNGTLIYSGSGSNVVLFQNSEYKGGLGADWENNLTLAQNQWVAPIGIVESSAQAVPEPAPIFGAAVLGLGLVFRRKKVAASIP